MSSYHFNDSFVKRFYELTKKIQKPGLFSGASSKGFRISCHEERTGDQGSWAKEASLDFIPTIEVRVVVLVGYYKAMYFSLIELGNVSLMRNGSLVPFATQR